MKDWPFLISGLLGIGAIGMTLFLSLIGPREVGALPEGFVTPVMAFEFAGSADEVMGMFAPDGSAAAMDRVNRWDFLYMALYGLFLFAFALACAWQTGNRFFYIPAALALLIPFADALENVQLLRLTYQTTVGGGDMAGLLAQLRWFTWLKWGGLTVYFLLLWPYFRGLGGRWRWIGVVGILPALLAIIAVFNRGLPNELMALAIGLMFILLTLYAWIRVASSRWQVAGSKWQVAGGR
jgi:hypothetical protein